jgi:hypothetical protein
MSQPRIQQLHTWESHEKRVLEVLLESLSFLQNETNLDQSEIYLNRQLYFCLLKANRKLWNLGRGFDHPPTPEGKNAPDPDDEHRAKRENKIPDFQWSFIDHLEPDPTRSAHYFLIECKRLGAPPRSDWVLNENYVQQGILRFITEEHGYAKGEKSGAMIGYVQNMEFADILREVNAVAVAVSIPELILSAEDWQEQGISHLEHELTRSFVFPQFLLKHLWVDLRSQL